nr:uncharacterized mitochondrial protein AtMg00810-like [Tanacetum cinerariifolium]GEZ81821.1 uncharacterized mitochondrial protein AtMg00810-like [Tanacetum cinerariifolium]
MMEMLPLMERSMILMQRSQILKSVFLQAVVGQSRKQDDNTNKEAKGKIHVESFIRYRDLSVDFKDCSDNSINEVNAAENDFQSVKIDQTLIIKRQKGDILLVKIYVDDIIFGATNKDLCKSFEKLIKDKFQMSSMGLLTLFLGLHVKQKNDGIFISQDKYVAEILRKFGLTEGKSASTPFDIEKPLLKDPDGEDADVHTYRSMIGSLMYLTSSRPDIMFTDSPFDLVVYSDSDYAGASLDKKSTTGGCQFLGCRLISWQCKKQTVVATSSTEAEYVAVASCCA